MDLRVRALVEPPDVVGFIVMERENTVEAGQPVQEDRRVADDIDVERVRTGSFLLVRAGSG